MSVHNARVPHVSSCTYDMQWEIQLRNPRKIEARKKIYALQESIFASKHDSRMYYVKRYLSEEKTDKAISNDTFSKVGGAQSAGQTVSGQVSSSIGGSAAGAGAGGAVGAIGSALYEAYNYSKWRGQNLNKDINEIFYAIMETAPVAEEFLCRLSLAKQVPINPYHYLNRDSDSQVYDLQALEEHLGKKDFDPCKPKEVRRVPVTIAYYQPSMMSKVRIAHQLGIILKIDEEALFKNSQPAVFINLKNIHKQMENDIKAHFEEKKAKLLAQRTQVEITFFKYLSELNEMFNQYLEFAGLKLIVDLT